MVIYIIINQIARRRHFRILDSNQLSGVILPELGQLTNLRKL
jgi:hypothetical protein